MNNSSSSSSRLTETLDDEYFDRVFEGAGEDLREINCIYFERCIFRKIKCPEIRLINVTFVDCAFEDCDLARADLTGSTFNDLRFDQCDLRGTDFTVLNKSLLRMAFRQCRLDYASFFQMKLQGLVLENCSVREALFEGASLRQSSFVKSKVEGCNFMRADLTNTDFRGAEGLVVDFNSAKCKGLKITIWDATGILRAYGLDIEIN
jgi:fluoroquinolone resistance protein